MPIASTKTPPNSPVTAKSKLLSDKPLNDQAFDPIPTFTDRTFRIVRGKFQVKLDRSDP